MNLKFKIIFFNFIIFLIIFDLIYMLVWIFSVHMNPIQAFLIAGIAAIVTPWARASEQLSGRKVIIRSYAFIAYHKYLKKENS